jgi:nicotinate-nucleotide adenylyltransferase
MIGVLGGSFDPIHFGHINPLYELSDIFEFDQIRLVPTYNSAVNKTFNASANHRFNMVSLISSSETNNFVADNVEIVKQNTSYTYETIKIIKKQQNRDDICLIVGLDVFLNIETWYNYMEILKDTNIVVINRPGYNIEKINNMSFEILERITSNKIDFIKNEKKQIYIHKSPSIKISSSQIRDVIKSGNKPLGLIPGAILTYIKRNNLYIGK